MDRTYEVEAAVRMLEQALARAEERLQEAVALAGEDPMTQPLRDQVDVLRLEIERLRREFAVQLARLLRPH